MAAATRVAVQGLGLEERRKYKAWLALVDKAVTFRNDLAHAVPVTTPEGTQGLFRRRPNQPAGIVRSTIKEIETMTKHFQEAILAGSALLDDLGRDED